MSTRKLREISRPYLQGMHSVAVLDRYWGVVALSYTNKVDRENFLAGRAVASGEPKAQYDDWRPDFTISPIVGRMRPPGCQVIARPHHHEKRRKTE